MKRRSEGNWKLRRTVKRNNGFSTNNSSLLFYCKIVLIWSSVIFVDYMSELRFEYLWPFYILLRSVYDSYRYKGLAFSFLFICIAITSDLTCLFFIPLNWIFFIASSFVWIQYVWMHSEKGICLPTIILWLLFIWMEAKIRWKDNRNMPHLDLCRPFAAHCIGYPVVTLGFGFKSYISYRIRQRKQREVAKENEFYMQLLQKALPQEEEELEASQDAIDTSNSSTASVAANGSLPQASCKAEQTSTIPATANVKQPNCKNKNNAEKENGGYLESNGHDHHNQQSIPNNLLSKLSAKANNLNLSNLNNVKNTNNNSSYQQIQNGLLASTIKETNVANQKSCTSPYKSKDDHNTYSNSNTCKKEYEKEKIIKDRNVEESTTSAEPTSQKQQRSREKQTKDNQQYHQQHQPLTNGGNSSSGGGAATAGEKEKLVCDQCTKAEQEAKRLKSELGAMKSLEQETKQKYDVMKGNYLAKQREHEEAQKQINDLQSQERKNRQLFDSQLNQERKLRKQADDKANIPRCSDNCKVKKMQLDNENNKLRRELLLMEETKQNLEKHNRQLEHELRKYDNELKSRDNSQISDMAMRSALAVMQEKNSNLEKNLSAETRVKLDLFSALGEARRQLEIKDSCLRSKDKQLEDLKSKTAQLLAVMNCESVDTQLSTVLPLNSIAMTSSNPQSALSVLEQLNNSVKNSQLNAG